jgi:signal transduction histidine kinase
LRGFISTLQPARTVAATSPERPLEEELRDLADRLARYWTIDVTTKVKPAELKVPDRISYDLAQIVREAVANAVRHGGARRVEAAVDANGEALAIQIADDGKGFAFEGDLGGSDLDQAGGAPRSLYERVRTLDGRLRLRSSGEGATLIIEIPLGAVR